MAARGIYLIGFSGTGKSTVARAVAAALGWPAHDLDRAIVEAAGTTIPQIFEREGETAFRQRETEALRAVAARFPCIVATGGGAPLRDENRLLMRSTGWLVALEARPEVIHERLRRQADGSSDEAVRPLLSVADPLGRIRSLKQARQAVYALADWTVHTDRLTPDEVAAEVVRAYRLLEAAASRDAAPERP